jgi:hypothetical protein
VSQDIITCRSRDISHKELEAVDRSRRVKMYFAVYHIRSFRDLKVDLVKVPKRECRQAEFQLQAVATSRSGRIIDTSTSVC